MRARPNDCPSQFSLEDNRHTEPIRFKHGICGACIAPVLEGIPDRRDFVLSDAERKAGRSMVICCSRSRSPELVLDL